MNRTLESRCAMSVSPLITRLPFEMIINPSMGILESAFHPAFAWDVFAAAGMLAPCAGENGNTHKNYR